MDQYVRHKRTANVTIEGGEFDGLKLVLSLSVSTGDFIDFQVNRWGPDADIMSQAEAVKWFAEKVLISWNHCEPDPDNEELPGEPTPANYAGFMTLEPGLVLEIMRRWREVITDIDIPLEQPSPAGTPSKAPSTRTATPSRSQRRQRKQK